jgi:hypothetical protein
MAATLTQATDAYLDNADYDTNGSVSEAKAFRTACRQLLVLLPQQQMRGAGGNRQEVQFRMEAIEEALQGVEAWLALNDTDDPAIIHPTFSDSRGDM